MWNDSDAVECLGSEGLAHSNVVLALMIIYSIGILVSILLLLTTVGYLLFIKKLRTKLQFYESQICLSMAMSEIFNFLGFLMSPCQPLAIDDEPFKVFCISCSAIQLLMEISTFSWILLLVLHICHLVAKACREAKLDAKSETEPRKRRLTLEEMALEENGATHSKLEHKISKDLLEIWKNNAKYKFNQEQENRKLEKQESKVERKIDQTRWYIEAFGEFSFPVYVSMIIGYVPAVLLTLISCLTRPPIEIPLNGIDLERPWDDIQGLDIYCWPGTETQMLYYMLAVVFSLFVAILYFRVKAIQMVRILQGGPLDALMSISNWQRQNSNPDGSPKVPLFHLDTTSFELRVVVCTWIIGILQTFYIWGLMLPFTTLKVLKCVIFFLYHVFYDIQCSKSKSDIDLPE
ncbi:hypothetical protein TCAL_07541, partial [Tigriopus californicus]